MKIAKLPLILLLLIPTGMQAASNYECSASDSTEKQWVAASPYKRLAINKAYDACKKESTVPSTCKTSREACEDFNDLGVSLEPQWQCTALDILAKPWVSNSYPKRDDAAIAAKAYCQERSADPDSCYINLLTCKNLNDRA